MLDVCKQHNQLMNAKMYTDEPDKRQKLNSCDSFSNKMQQARISAGKSLADLSKLTCIDVKELADYERGTRTATSDVMAAIMKSIQDA